MKSLYFLTQSLYTFIGNVTNHCSNLATGPMNSQYSPTQSLYVFIGIVTNYCGNLGIGQMNSQYSLTQSLCLLCLHQQCDWLLKQLGHWPHEQSVLSHKVCVYYVFTSSVTGC